MRQKRYLQSHGGPGLHAVARELQSVLEEIRAVGARIQAPV